VTPAQPYIVLSIAMCCMGVIVLTIYCSCNQIHKSIAEQFKVAIVYGKSVKHQPQRVGLSHELADEDISKSRPYIKGIGRFA